MDKFTWRNLNWGLIWRGAWFLVFWAFVAWGSWLGKYCNIYYPPDGGISSYCPDATLRAWRKVRGE